MIQATIGGVQLPIIMDSLAITHRIEERGTASFIVLDKGNQFRFSEGEPVIVGQFKAPETTSEARFDESEFDGWGFGGGLPLMAEAVRFTGVVTRIETEILNSVESIAKHYIECTNYHYATDKRLVAKSYEDKDIEFIVTDLFNEYLLPEGLEIGRIDTDFIITQVSFNYVFLSEALDSLADRTGYTWYVDNEKRLYFIKRNTFVNPKTFKESDMLDRSIKLTTSNSKYRNRQIVKNVRDITSPQTEIVRGDGENRTFTMGYAIAKVPTVETSTDGILWDLKTVGIRGLEDGYQFYWSGGEKEITQDRNDTPLSDTEFIRVTYRGEIRLLVATQDNEKVLTRKNLEQGGTGLVESVHNELAETRESAYQLGARLIEKYGRPSTTLVFETRYTEIRPGELINVEMNTYKLTDQLLVESIDLRTVAGEDVLRVRAVLGTEQKSWQDYFNTLYRQASQKELDTDNVSEIITVPMNFQKTWTSGEQPNIYTETYPLGQSPSNSLYPMFDEVDRNKIIEVYDSNGILGRKKIAQVSGNLTAIALISGADYAGKDITKFAWYAGIEASETLGTGFKIDEQNETEDGKHSPWPKTSIELWQVQHMSIKGW